MVKARRRRHNCKADSNTVLVSWDWVDGVLVGRMQCKRCGAIRVVAPGEE